MAAPSIAPLVKVPEVKRTMRACEPQPFGPKHLIQELLFKIFEGHEEFLGWTPD